MRNGGFLLVDLKGFLEIGVGWYVKGKRKEDQGREEVKY